MQLRIKNENSGKISKFSEGEYLIGKGVDCDLMIDGPNMKDAHARLIVSTDEILLSSLDETQPIDYLGVPVLHIAFTRNFQVNIDTVTITGVPAKTTRLNRSVSKKLGVFQSLSGKFSAKDVRVLSILVMMAFVLITYFLVRIPSQARFGYFKHQEIVKRGISLSRYLAEINRDAVQTDAFDKIRVTPISLEEGVRYSYIVNIKGKILAPLEKAGSQFDRDLIKHLDVQKGPVVTEGEKNEKIIIYPIAGIDGTIGAAIIGYDIRYADTLPVPTGGLMSLVTLLVLIILGGLTGLWIARLFLKQINRLNDEVNLAIKNDTDQIHFDTPYAETEHLLTNINRLLARKAVADHKDAPDPMPKSPKADSGNGAMINMDPLTVPGFIRNSDHAWCLLNVRDYQVSDWNQRFISRYAKPDTAKDGHLAEIIEDPDLVNAISGVIDDAVDAGVQSDNGTGLTLSKIRLNNHFTVIIFEEPDDRHSPGNV